MAYIHLNSIDGGNRLVHADEAARVKFARPGERTAILMTGHQRTFQWCWPSVVKHILPFVGDFDLYGAFTEGYDQSVLQAPWFWLSNFKDVRLPTGIHNLYT